MDIKYNHPAFIFGMSETGLAVARSLRKYPIKTIGISSSKVEIAILF